MNPRAAIVLTLAAVFAGLAALACGSPSGGTTSGTSGQPTQPPSVGVNVGDRAPSFTVNSVDGQTVTSQQLLDQGKPFIVYFYTTW